jgi:demethylmenaquinone methyltransferase/2-methoxy-6-polyprenyl-1,4-benzoquinol methylase
MNETLKVVRKTFTDWAPYYNATHAWTLPCRHQARLALGVQRGDRVLDLACGTGLNFLHLRELVGDEGHIMGVDVTPAMLDIARRLVQRHGWQNVQVREADAARLPFADASYDKAICTFAMNIIPDYTSAIAEVARVLVPGGRFVVLDVKLQPAFLARSPRLRSLFVRMMHICAADISHQTIEELQRVFANVQVRKYWAGWVYIAVGTKG